MNMRACLISCLLGSYLVGTEAFAQSALIHIQGEEGSREAYFADFGVVMDRTPMDKVLGPMHVKQLDTTVVYENPDKPEFSGLRLQFECVVKYAYDGKHIPPQPAFDAPVKVRVGEGSWKLRREDLKGENLPVGDWRTSSSPVLLKLHKIACNEDVMRTAFVKAAKHNENVDVFRDEIEKIGLPRDLQLMGHEQRMPSDYLEFSWSVLWSGVKRPDPSGRWSSRPTKKEAEEYRARMAELQQQFDQVAAGIQPQLEANIKEMDAKLKFTEALRRGHKLTRRERNMLGVWEGKTDQDVALKMGAPISSRAGDLLYLTYGKEFDNRVIVANGKGAVWEEGLYEHCNVQFILYLDAKNIFRVVDVKIWTGGNRLGQTMFACDGLLEEPN